MTASAHSASSHQQLLSPTRANSFYDPQLLSHARQHTPSAPYDPSNGQNPLIARDLTSVSTNDLQFQKVLAKDTDVGEETVYQVEITNDELMRKSRRSELASKKTFLTRVWKTALVTTLVLVALGAGIGGLAYWISIPKVITQPFLLYGETCVMNSRSCDATRLLWCPSGKCACIDTFNWNSTAQNCSCGQYSKPFGSKCKPYGRYGDPCDVNTNPCNPTYSLDCQAVINQTYSTGQSICDCNNATYLDVPSGSCVGKKSFNANCQVKAECQTWLGLSCSLSSGTPRCVCDSTSYWNGSFCTGNARGWEPCSGSIPCDATRGLTCNSSLSTCECDSLSFWDNVTTQYCQQKRSHGVTCRFDFQCNTTVGLSCPSVSTGCLCPPPSNPFMCDCQLGNFWDGQRCVPLHSFNGTCPDQYACGSNLVCFLGHCICPGNMIWDTSNSNCTCPGSTTWTVGPNRCI